MSQKIFSPEKLRNDIKMNETRTTSKPCKMILKPTLEMKKLIVKWPPLGPNPPKLQFNQTVFLVYITLQGYFQRFIFRILLVQIKMFCLARNMEWMRFLTIWVI